MILTDETQEILDTTGKLITNLNPKLIKKDNLYFIGDEVSELADSFNFNTVTLMQNFYNSTPYELPGVIKYDNNGLFIFTKNNSWSRLDNKQYEIECFNISENDVNNKEYIVDTVFNLIFNNVIIKDANFDDVIFTIDQFEKKKIIFRSKKLNFPLSIIVFNPTDNVNNPLKNKNSIFKLEKSQYQFDVSDFDLNNELTVILNNTFLSLDDFYIEQTKLNLNATHINIEDDYILKIFQNKINRFCSMNITKNKNIDTIYIPKLFFNNINIKYSEYEILDIKELTNGYILSFADEVLKKEFKLIIELFI